MSVYTKFGDKGKTSDFTGKRISKSSRLINAIGTIDELNSYLGVVGDMEDIQINLFAINAILAGAKVKFPKDATAKLEKIIDDMELRLPKQKKFLIYSGSLRSRELYFARALARRAERCIVALHYPPSTIHHSLVFLNRLSDFLFILARYTNFKKGITEKEWKK